MPRRVGKRCEGRRAAPVCHANRFPPFLFSSREPASREAVAIDCFRELLRVPVNEKPFGAPGCSPLSTVTIAAHFAVAFLAGSTIILGMPEKSLSEIPRPAREQYEKALAAFKIQNFDYAIALFSQVLQKEPGFFDCRQALRATQFKKSGASGGFLKKFGSGFKSSPFIAKGQGATPDPPVLRPSTKPNRF